MNTTFSTALLATLGIFMFSLCCFAQESGPPTFSVLERDDNGLNDVDSDPGIGSMLLTLVEDSDVETYASSAGPDNQRKRDRRAWCCLIKEIEMEMAIEEEQRAWENVKKVINDKDSSKEDVKRALKKWEAAFKAATEAIIAWQESGCGG